MQPIFHDNDSLYTHTYSLLHTNTLRASYTFPSKSVGTVGLIKINKTKFNDRTFVSVSTCNLLRDIISIKPARTSEYLRDSPGEDERPRNSCFSACARTLEYQVPINFPRANYVSVAVGPRKQSPVPTTPLDTGGDVVGSRASSCSYSPAATTTYWQRSSKRGTRRR